MKIIKQTLATLALLTPALWTPAALMPTPEDGTAQAAAPQQAAQKAAPQPAARKAAARNLAIFIFDGVQIIDYTGPFEVLGHAWDDEQPMFNIYTVAAKADPVTTNMGMTVIPKYTFDNMPKADVLVLPGGGVRRSMEDPKVIKWVQDTSAGAEYVMSVCNGAFFLGRAGLLDGLTATTFHGLIDELKTIAPKAKVVNDQRFVDNGKIITTAGLSSGIDGALHLVEKLAGYGKAQEIALGLEYNWQPELNYARASPCPRAAGREGRVGEELGGETFDDRARTSQTHRRQARRRLDEALRLGRRRLGAQRLEVHGRRGQGLERRRRRPPRGRRRRHLQAHHQARARRRGGGVVARSEVENYSPTEVKPPRA